MRILGDSWYATSIKGLCDPLDLVIERQCPRWMQTRSRKPGILRSLLLFKLGRDYDLVFTAQPLPGAWLVVLLEALLGAGKRRLVLLEFIPLTRSTWYLRLRKLHEDVVFRYATRWSIRRAHVLTHSERRHYARRFRLPESRFEFVPWPLLRETDQPPDCDGLRSSAVVASGRMGCDWATLIRAAEGMDWKLTMICNRSELKGISAAAKNISATVMSDVPLDQHQSILRSSAVYVIAVREDFVSVGQIRVMNAIRAGIPIVATRVSGLEGYLVDNETALLVEPGNHIAMRRAVERLLDEPHTRTRLATKAYELAKSRTFGRYLEEVEQLIRGVSSPETGMTIPVDSNNS